MSQRKERKIQIHNSHAKTARNVLHSSVLSVATSTTTKCKPLNFMHATGKKKKHEKEGYNLYRKDRNGICHAHALFRRRPRNEFALLLCKMRKRRGIKDAPAMLHLKKCCRDSRRCQEEKK